VATVVIGQLTQAIRNFAKNLEGWLKSALVGAPDDIIKIKVGDVDSVLLMAIYFMYFIYVYTVYIHA